MLTFFLLLNTLIPISLIISLEVVKFVQAMFIEFDLHLYDQRQDIPAKVQTFNIIEELGQVDYIFSDKTGTLTCNVMEFKKISLNGISYGTDAHVPGHEKLPHVDFVNKNINSKSDWAQVFLLRLAVCHTIVCEEKDGKVE